MAFHFRNNFLQVYPKYVLVWSSLIIMHHALPKSIFIKQSHLIKIKAAWNIKAETLKGLSGFNWNIWSQNHNVMLIISYSYLASSCENRSRGLTGIILQFPCCRRRLSRLKAACDPKRCCQINLGSSGAGRVMKDKGGFLLLSPKIPLDLLLPLFRNSFIQMQDDVGHHPGGQQQ